MRLYYRINKKFEIGDLFYPNLELNIGIRCLTWEIKKNSEKGLFSKNRFFAIITEKSILDQITILLNIFFIIFVE